MTHEEMAAELTRAGWRVRAPITKETCKHSMRIGSGMIGSDGSSKSSWYCPECGDSGHSETPSRPATEA